MVGSACCGEEAALLLNSRGWNFVIFFVVNECPGYFKAPRSNIFMMGTSKKMQIVPIMTGVLGFSRDEKKKREKTVIFDDDDNFF